MPTTRAAAAFMGSKKPAIDDDATEDYVSNTGDASDEEDYRWTWKTFRL